MEITTIRHDINEKISEMIAYVQHDNESREIRFEVSDKKSKRCGGWLDLTDCSVKLVSIKPSGLVSFIDGEVTDVNGKFKFTVTDQMLAESGFICCQYIIVNPSYTLHGPHFIISVAPALDQNDIIISSNELSALILALQNSEVVKAVLTIFRNGYDTYVESGGELSFNEWLANFKGDPGTDGQNGQDGTNGQNGTSADITAVSATVDNNVGTPAVSVTLGGTALARTLAFAFSNLKGRDGQDGADGADGQSVNVVTLANRAAYEALVVKDPNTVYIWGA